MSQEARYINPLTDFGFKKIFGDEEIMRDFLNDIIEPESLIVKVIFLDKEMPPETKYEHGIVYDMRCLLDSGEEVIVEMQNRGQDYFKDRICYYMARAISTQGEKNKNDWKFDIHPVYGVFFMNFHLKDTPSVAQIPSPSKLQSALSGNDAKGDSVQHDIRHIQLADTMTGEVFSDRLQFWLIELPRYRHMKESDCKTNQDYWLYNLTHLETMNTTVPFQTQKPIFNRLESIADMARLTREEREHYHISLDSYRTNLAVMDHERNEGRAEGRAEGREEGREEGRAEGQKIAKHDTAVMLKRMGILTAEQISEATGLTIEEIQSL